MVRMDVSVVTAEELVQHVLQSSVLKAVRLVPHKGEAVLRVTVVVRDPPALQSSVRAGLTVAWWTAIMAVPGVIATLDGSPASRSDINTDIDANGYNTRWH